MTILLPKIALSISNVSEYPDDNTIINQKNYLDDDPYDMFDDPFEDLLHSNVLTVQE